MIDSSVFIAGERKSLTVPELIELLRAKWGDEEVVLSAVTAMELVHGVWRAQSPAQRARRQDYVEEIFARFPVRPVTLQTARIAGEIDATQRAKGTTIPTADLLIGAVALELGFAVGTHSARHFRLLPNLHVRTLD